MYSLVTAFQSTDLRSFQHRIVEYTLKDSRIVYSSTDPADVLDYARRNLTNYRIEKTFQPNIRG